MTVIAGYWAVSISLAVSMLLAVLPVSPPYHWFRPEWTAMVIIFWSVSTPGRVGIGVAWLAGLVLDGVQGVTLGQNALGLAVIAYVAGVLHQRIRHFALLQQAGMVFVLVGLYLLLCYWVQSLASTSAKNLYFLGGALSSTLLWPWFAWLMQSYKRLFS